MIRNALIFACAIVVIGSPRSGACGPFFPNAYLLFGEEERVLDLPEKWFHLILPDVAVAQNERYPTRRGSWQRTLAGDSHDLHEALAARGDAPERLEELVEKYDAMRAAMNSHAPLRRATSKTAAAEDTAVAQPPAPFDLTPYDELLAAIPKEFAFYVRGAAAYRAGDTKSAKTHWSELLALPEAERQYRSTWAAFMLGRMLRENDRVESDAYFEQVLALVNTGFQDSLNLAADAQGWQARSALDAAEFLASARRYLDQFLHGPVLESREAAESLRIVCRAALQHTDQFDALAQDPDTRRVMSAWLVSHPEEDVNVMRHWLETAQQYSGGDSPIDDPLDAAVAQLGPATASGSIESDFQREAQTRAQFGYRLSMAGSATEKVWFPRENPLEGDLQLAMHYYLDGYTHSPAQSEHADTNSLNFACGRVLKRPELFDQFAADPVCRPVLTAWLVSHPNNYPDVDSQWLDAVQRAIADGPVGGADQLAWVAYNDGDMESAARWLESADPNSPYTSWIRSKLLLREGMIDEALEQLRTAMRAFPPDPPVVETYDGPLPLESEIAQSEIGILLLGRQDYVNALGALMRSPYWMDAAYVAERVLTVDELRDYIDAHRDDEEFAHPFNEIFWYGHETSKLQLLEYLLARRYTRLGQWSLAMPLLPEPERMHAQELGDLLTAATAPPPAKGFLGSVSDYVSGLWGSGDERVIDRERAGSFYRAAEITRAHGMELAGTELEPDWFAFRGYFELTGVTENRATGFDNDNTGYAPALAEVLSASDDELQRASAHAPEPDKRFHYRYAASELMWHAAEYLPDNDLKCASALYWGGVYLENRDPQAADKFYKALVWRNLNLPYAQAADQKRWFPAKPPE
jgi:hypothetical protein